MCHARHDGAAHQATRNAKTGSLDTSWKRPAYVGVTSRTTRSRGRRERAIGATAHAQPRSERRRAAEDDLRETAPPIHMGMPVTRRDRRAEDLQRRERRIAVRELQEREPVVPRSRPARAATRAPGAHSRERRDEQGERSRDERRPLCQARPHEGGTLRGRPLYVAAHAEDGDKARRVTAHRRRDRRCSSSGAAFTSSRATTRRPGMCRSTSRSETGCVDRAVPYRDFRVEYPPGALPAFLLPSLVARGAEPAYVPELNGAARSYARSFAALMTALLAATVVFAALSLAALRATVGHAAVALGLVGATPLLCSASSPLTRFDALPVALTAAASQASCTTGPASRMLALGLAVAAKLYRLLLLPLVALYVDRRFGAARGGALRGHRGRSLQRPSCCRSSRSLPARPGSRSAPSSLAVCRSRAPGKPRDGAAGSRRPGRARRRSGRVSRRAAPAMCGAPT